MSDLDVQDIRDMVAEQREEALRQQEQPENNRPTGHPATDKMSMDLLEKHKAAEAKQQERNRRLGLESSSSSNV